jgi:hypothetical protein
MLLSVNYDDRTPEHNICMACHTRRTWALYKTNQSNKNISFVSLYRGKWDSQIAHCVLIA